MAKLNKQIRVYYTFYCPGCECDHIYHTEGGNIIWDFNGDMEKPTFRPSLLNTWTEQGKEHRCHLFITDGMIQYCNDCTHSLSGKTIELK